MGMFDEIKVNVDLPLDDELKSLSVDWKNKIFQTKDLENLMSFYIITEDGDILEEIVEREYIPYTEGELGTKPKFSVWKDVIEKSRRTQKLDYHGTLIFYCGAEISEEEDMWIDFKAYFSYGKLDKIILFNKEKTKNHRITLNQLMEQKREEDKKLINKVKKTLRKIGWHRLCHALVDTLNYIGDVCQRMNIFIYKKIM